MPDGTVKMRVFRPGFRSVLDDLTGGRANALLAEDLDRVCRDDFIFVGINDNELAWFRRGDIDTGALRVDLERFGRRYFQLLPKPKENSANNKLAALREPV